MARTPARSWLGAPALLLLVIVVVAVHAHYHHHRLHPGERLVALHLASLDGNALTFAPTGHPMIINIFASWCEPCRAETPGLAAAAPRLRKAGIEVIGIDQNEPSEAVQRFVREFGLPYPVFVDTGDVTHDLLGARMIPTTIYVDASGVIRWMHAGPLPAQSFFTLANRPESAG